MKNTTPSTNRPIVDHRNLHVWNKALHLAVEVHELTSKLPEEEKYGLCSQMGKAAISIASDIAEGAARGRWKGFTRFLHIASGSIRKLDTQLVIMGKAVLVTDRQAFLTVQGKLGDVKRRPHDFLRSLKH